MDGPKLRWGSPLFMSHVLILPRFFLHTRSATLEAGRLLLSRNRSVESYYKTAISITKCMFRLFYILFIYHSSSIVSNTDFICEKCDALWYDLTMGNSRLGVDVKSNLSTLS